MQTTTLPTPTTEDLAMIWQCRRIFPKRDDEHYYMACQLYDHLKLDWRVPEHRAHVEAIVDRHAAPPRGRETND